MSDLYLEELVKRRKIGTDQAHAVCTDGTHCHRGCSVASYLEPDHYCGFYRDLRGGHLYFSEISDRMGISVCQRGTGCGSYHKQGKEKTNGIL